MVQTKTTASTILLLDYKITKATLTVTADAQTKVYGQANDVLTFQYNGWQNGDDEADLTTAPMASTSIDETSPANDYTDAITFIGGSDENYSFDYIAADYEVTKATLTVTADAQTKVYGQANDVLTFQYNGWQNGDDEADLTTAPMASTSIDETSPANDYTNAITVSVGSDENYSFTYVPADYEITKAMLTVTADAQTKVYGQANDVLTFQYNGWQNGDDEADLTTAPSASTTIDETSPVNILY